MTQPQANADLFGDPNQPKIVRVWDCETTGFADDPKCETIELGRYDVDLDTLEVCNPWRGFILPSGPIPPEVMAVHHITRAEIEAEGPAERPWGQLFEGCGPNDILAAHNASFEQAIHSGNGRPWICTYKGAMAVWPDAPGHSNQVLRYWMGIDELAYFDSKAAMPPHRALPDAYVTAHILAKLLEHKSAQELIEITKNPVLLTTLTFGKHKGQRYDAVPTDYLTWIRDKSDLNEDTKYSANYWLDQRVGEDWR